MYVTDFLCTYKQVDESIEDSDALYQAQFLQVFGCDNGYDDNKVSNGLIEARKIIETHPIGKNFLKDIVKQGLPPTLAIFSSLGGESDENSLDTIFRTYYGWGTMDITHSLVCKIKNNIKITKEDTNKILNVYKEYYGM